MSADLPNEFDSFKPSDEEQMAIANATLSRVEKNMTDQALVELVKAGIVQATTDKQRAARIVSGILAMARCVTGVLKL
jgi:hypothetical protein